MVLANNCCGLQLPGVSIDIKAYCTYFYFAYDGSSLIPCMVLKSWIFTELTQSMKRPKLFWVSAAAPLTSVILSTLLVFCLKLKSHKISVVRIHMLSLLPSMQTTNSHSFRVAPLNLISFRSTDWLPAKGFESTFS